MEKHQIQEEEDEEDIAMAKFIESLQKQADKENFQKNLDDCLMIAVLYQIKRKMKKIYFDGLFNSKIFYIKFCLMKLKSIKFCQTYRERDKGGDWTTSNTIFY